MASLIPAAGTLVWRRSSGTLEVALVHRPKYDDWSWPKGKLDAGEHPCVAAARETLEETGLEVRLGLPLPRSEYPVLDGNGGPAVKEVHYWAAQVVGGTGALEHEIDEVVWLDTRVACDRLDYTRDRTQLLALIRADRDGYLDTWPLAIVRHAKARPRSAWSDDDRLRPLDAVGEAQTPVVSAVLGAYGVTRLVSSSSRRCAATFEPYAAERQLKLRTKNGLSEEAFAADPSRALHHLQRVLAHGEPAAVCTHGPVLPILFEVLAALVDPEHQRAKWSTEELYTAADSGLAKGETLVCHMRGLGPAARVVGVERIES